MSEQVVEEYLKQIKENNKVKYELQYKIKKIEIENKNLEKKIYKTCEHKWEKDWDDCYSRHKVCTKCKLANLPYVYN